MRDNPSSTLEKIRQAALTEFLENGFQGASLRQIVKNAGVTTGAFYGYFSSKEALFASIVEPHAAVLMGRFMEAQSSFADLPEAEQPEHMGTESGAYLAWMVDYVCAHREPVKLLLCRAEGTSYEDFLHKMVEVEVEATLRYMEVLHRLGQDVPELGRSLCHIIVSGMFNSLFEVVVHDMPYEQALRDVNRLQAFYTAGWLKLMGGDPCLFGQELAITNLNRGGIFMAQRKKSDVAVLLDYAGSHRGLTFLGLALSAASMLLSMAPYICIWLAARDLIAAAPDWTQARSVAQYGWMAFAFAVGGILVYFAALMCTHLAAFRTASNIRKRGVAHVMKAPLGFFDANASGLIRGRLDAAAADTETLLAHNLADIVGTITLFIAMLVMMFVFDWRMGAACLLAAVISILAMFSMMGGKNAKLMAEYQAAQDRMTKAGTEYVRGIPVVKIFQQTVYSFKAFQQAIEDYSDKSEYYQANVCRVPQSINLTFTEGAFVFLVPAVLFLAPGALAGGDFAGFVTNFAFYAVFSAIISTALAKIMFAASGMMLAGTALGRIDQVMCAPELKVPQRPQTPQTSRVEFEDVSFTYDGAQAPALSHVSFTAEPGQTVALVGPSGGGKTTAASLIPRFWDVTSGAVKVGGVDVRQIDPHVLMDQIAFVFQNSRLFKTSILENVRAARPEATREQVRSALMAAQCGDILEKLPQGMDTLIGSEGTYLSGGEQQRIALARAILKDAPIVVLDEATAFADPENEVLIQKAFSELTRGRTVIMIAHRLSTVVGADKIVVLEEGRIVEQGTHEALTAAGGLYARMWADYNQAVQWKITSEQ